MRILHTADWHLGDRLGRIDRTKDLQRAVETVGALCLEQEVDVLLVAGDLFSELARPDSLRESIEHLGKTFVPFLRKGGTVLAITGNHDNETFCQTLRCMMELAAPANSEDGQLVPAGRLYLAPVPTLVRVADGAGMPVQFVLMPYPTSRYLDERSRRYPNLEEKNRTLHQAYAARLRRIQQSTAFDPRLQTVLSAHIHVQGAVLPHPFRITEQESIVFSQDEIPRDWAYVALGHIHQPQALAGLAHVRYAGSIERLDLGEWKDQKSVTILDLGPDGLRGEPMQVPLAARPFYDVVIDKPAEQISYLRQRYPEAAQALVRYHVEYEAGKDILNDLLAELDRIFPYWYDRTWLEVGEKAWLPSNGALAAPAESFRQTVLSYLEGQLGESRDRPELLRLAEELLQEEETAERA